MKVLANPQGRYFFSSVSHKLVKKDLFPEQLALTQVAQGGNSGDCYLLASILAILALPEGESHLRSVMVDKGSSVEVSLFDDYGQIKVLNIEKSLPSTSGLLARSFLWVAMLEKAYVVLKGGDYNKVLEKGHPHSALKALLGGYTENLALPYQTQSPLSQLVKRPIHGCNGQDIYTLMFLLRPYDPNATQSNIIEHVFHNEAHLLPCWWDFVSSHQHAWLKLLNAHHPLKRNHVFDLLNKLCKEQDQAVLAVKRWLQDYQVLGSDNAYDREHLNLYERLKQTLIEQRPMVVSPKPNPPQGITPCHSYAVIGLKDSRVSERKFVTLRNPHHEQRPWLSKLFFDGGRSATEVIEQGKVALKFSSSKASTFDMELNDFCKAFQYVDVGTALQTSRQYIARQGSKGP